MSFIVIAAILTAILSAMVTAPLYRQNRRLAYLLTLLIPLLALIGYFLWGHLDMTN